MHPAEPTEGDALGLPVVGGVVRLAIVCRGCCVGVCGLHSYPDGVVQVLQHVPVVLHDVHLHVNVRVYTRSIDRWFDVDAIGGGSACLYYTLRGRGLGFGRRWRWCWCF